MDNVIEYTLESVRKYADRVLVVNNGEKHTYADYYRDFIKVSQSITGYRVLIKVSDKYLYVVAAMACIFKRAMPFFSNPKNTVFDGYSFDLIIDDEFVIKALEENEFVEYEYKPVSDTDVLMVMLSSGTSKTAKPIVLSHRTIIKNIQGAREVFQFGMGWTFVNILPMDHIFGFECDFLTRLFKGSKMIFSYSVMEYFANLKKYEPDAISVPNSILKTICQLVEENGFDVLGNNLKVIVVGGSKCDTKLYEHFKSHGIYICPTYGLTECGPTVAMCSQTNFMPDSDGKILPCHQVVIDEYGKIIVKGDALMLNYLDLYEKGVICEQVDTKDVGYIKDGYIFVTGRYDNLIVLDNGFKIQPETFESDLRKEKGVIDCVIYYYDKKLYLDVVVGDGFDTDLKKKYYDLEITINFVSEIKKNALGKIDRGFYGNGKKAA